jgi:hypothetical protein
MKTFLNRLLKSRITRWGFLAGLLLAVGVTAGWMNHRQYQLGGTFIGGSLWSLVQTPLDPDGRTAAIVVKTLDDDGSLAGLITAFGGNMGSDLVGEEQMISRDTAKWTGIGYAQVAGVTPRITAIFVYGGTLKFTDPGALHMDLSFHHAPTTPPSARQAERLECIIVGCGDRNTIRVPGKQGAAPNAAPPHRYCVRPRCGDSLQRLES